MSYALVLKRLTINTNYGGYYEYGFDKWYLSAEKLRQW